MQLILDNQKINQKVRRMAFEIIENNLDSASLVLVGIDENGMKLARMMAAVMKGKGLSTITVTQLTVEKEAPWSQPIVLDEKPLAKAGVSLAESQIVLIDDVLNTGRTIAYSIPFLLSFNPQKIELAVLINRFHNLFPIHAKYTGLALATTLGNHVTVEMSKGKSSAYLK